MNSKVLSDHASPGPIKSVKVALTERCNLRCVYCAVSRDDYRGEDMNRDLTELAIQTIVSLARHQTLAGVDVNGHGETTYRDDWTDVCLTLVEQGIPIRMTTNLSKNYSSEELEVLACMTDIAISIDAADRELLRRLRRNVDVRQIIANVMAIRATALRLHRSVPRFHFWCGLYDKNTLSVEELARLAIVLGVKSLGFWKLRQFPDEGNVVPPDDRVIALDELPDDELVPRVRSIIGAACIAHRHGLHVETPMGYIEQLAGRIGLATDEQLDGRLNPGQTRDCLDPWTYVEIRRKGGVGPCCFRRDIGNVQQQPLPVILNSAEAKSLRESLLLGTLDDTCRNCPARKPIDTADLQAKVASLLEEVRLPENFDKTAYLDANPDVVTNGMNAADHFLEWGRLEGRALRDY